MRAANWHSAPLLAFVATLFACADGPTASYRSLGSRNPDRKVDPQTVVVGTNNAAVDVPAVQAAVGPGGNVLLIGEFSFDIPPIAGRTILVTTATNIKGVGPDGTGRAVLHGGWRAFDVRAPGANVSIQGMYFDHPHFAAIETEAARGILYSDNVVDHTSPEDMPPFGLVGTGFDFGALSPASLTGDVTVVDNQITIGGLPTQRTYGIGLPLGAGTVADPVNVYIARNTINDVTAHGIDMRNFVGRSVVEHNTISTGAVGGQQVALPDIFVDGIRALGTGSFTIRHNSITIGFANAAGIRLQGNTVAAGESQATIESNDISIALPEETIFGTQNAGIDIRRAASTNSILHNEIRGIGRAAIALTAESSPNSRGATLVPTGNVFLANNISTFNSTLADIYVGAGVVDTSITGGSGSLIDLGTGTTVTSEYSSNSRPRR